MAGAWARASVLIQDNAGNIAKVVFLVAAAAIDPGGGAISAIQTAIVAITKALSPRAESGAAAGATAATPDTGSFAAVEDRATLTFACSDGSTMVYEIPAPIDACFTAGTDTVDPTAGQIAAVISYIEASSVSKYGADLTFVKGIRTRKKQMKH